MLSIESLKAQSAEELAKAFLERYQELSDGSYEKIYKQLQYGADTVKDYEVPKIFGADKADLFTTEEGKYYRISFLKTNTNAKRFGKAALKAFKLIANDASYKMVTKDKYAGSILKNGREIMNYFIPDDVLYREYIFLDITDLAPLRPVLADETRYAQHFPTVPLVSKEPQMVISIDSLNPNRYKLYNGIFKDGSLLKGYQKFVGYNDFLNGTWYSDHWYYGSNALSTDVIFRPEGTTDSIYGHLNYNNFYKFYPDSRYESKKHASSFADNAPLWLRTTYEKHLTDEYNEQYIKDNTGSIEEVTRRSQESQRQQAEQEKHRCRYCGGSGLVGTGQFIMGKEVNKTCPNCHGTGRID